MAIRGNPPAVTVAQPHHLQPLVVKQICFVAILYLLNVVGAKTGDVFS